MLFFLSMRYERDMYLLTAAASPHKVKLTSEAYSEYFAGTPGFVVKIILNPRTLEPLTRGFDLGADYTLLQMVVD